MTRDDIAVGVMTLRYVRARFREEPTVENFTVLVKYEDAFAEYENEYPEEDFPGPGTDY